MNWYLDVLKNYAGFSGRARRKEYWMFALFNALITVVLTGVQGPYSMPAWAAFGLNLAWGFANARYPVDDE